MSGDGPVIPQVFYPDAEPRRYECRLPLRLESSANLREHWRARAARSKVYRDMSRAICRPPDWAETAKIQVIMWRIAPSQGLDDDNLAAAFKAVRDGIADRLGLKNDRDPRVKWEYRQSRGRWAVEILIEEIL